MDTFPTKPTLSQGESPSKYAPDEVDNEIKASTDGGYEFKRPRFTRAAPVIIKTGFISIPHEDYLILKAFWDAHKTTVAFIYHDYMNDIDRTVRFDTKPAWNAVSIGQNRMWSPDFQLKEV